MMPTVTLTIKNSTIQMSGKEGVSSSGCKLTLDSNIISSNTNEGVNLNNSTTFILTNNIIQNNGGLSSRPGVSINDQGSTGTFAFNTVVSNGPGGGTEGGIVCPSAGNNVLIQNSIVTLNSHNPATNGTQFAGKCQLSGVVTGPDSFSGAIQMMPTFVGPNDYHLDVGAGLTANEQCCIDQIASATTANADHDVDRGPRPKVAGGMLDRGAHEAK
jgi:parallel beta-helix repeat protein